ncbi:DUF2125 domain-containing protein [Parvularcula dongshanensis]|uniref:DUF2125 domain-containing protein n=1 Tax=Parvularcula dongshanensis TaxID=1173995 RepID=A0A840I1G4_9PROT|nr:DUF2125 domain-containing protein [Parvularcula dongshanensis]MBB4658587.1 hypothetical protein [Parvularcula dongshanensis]
MTDAVRTHRVRLALILAVVVLLLGGYTVLWFHGARIMRAELDRWVATERAAGREVAHGDIRMRGYPAALRAVVDAPSWAEPGQWSWNAETLNVIAVPYDPRRLILAPFGEQAVVYDDVTYALRAEDMRFSLSRGAFGAQIAGLTAESGERTLALAVGKANWARNEDGTAVLGVSGQDALYRVPSGAVSLPFVNAALSENGGGELQVQAFNAAVSPDAATDPTLLAGEGEASLDDAGYPAGRMTLRLRNPEPLVTVMSEQGAIPSNQAPAVLSVLASMQEDGETALPLSMRDGRLRVGFVPLADLPKIGG